MNNHIENIIIEYNFRDKALNNTYICDHIKECDRCKKLFNDYFDMLDMVNDSSTIPFPAQEEIENIFQNIISKKPIRKPSGHLKIIAIAASILIFIITGLFYYKWKEDFDNFQDSERNIITILSPEKNTDLEIISNLELFSNLEIIEHIEELEELNEVIDDEI